MEKLNFRNCQDVMLEELFDLVQVQPKESITLTKWVTNTSIEEISEVERQILILYQNRMIANLFVWNEQEWIANFIGPVMSLVDFTTKNTNSYHERPLSVVVNGIELAGKVDGMIASGKKEPKAPYFCLQEYKKEKDSDTSDPIGQALSAMIAAQAINNDNLPIYGGYVRGRDWFFMVLEGKEYAISKQYDASEEDVFDIFRILKALKTIVAERVALTLLKDK